MCTSSLRTLIVAYSWMLPEKPRWCLSEQNCQGNKVNSILSSSEDWILRFIRNYLYTLTWKHVNRSHRLTLFREVKYNDISKTNFEPMRPSIRYAPSSKEMIHNNIWSSFHLCSGRLKLSPRRVVSFLLVISRRLPYRTCGISKAPPTLYLIRGVILRSSAKAPSPTLSFMPPPTLREMSAYLYATRTAREPRERDVFPSKNIDVFIFYSVTNARNGEYGLFIMRNTF